MDKVILEVRAGTGGDEAAIFAGDLARMYERYALNRGWKFIVLDENRTSLQGYKTLVAQIEGQGALAALKNESGVHRVQRIPETEKAGRIHTSTVSVAIIPAVEAKKIEIKPRDLEISFARSSGPGGQNVNKVSTAVRIVHKLSGLVVASETSRSQAQNRELAMNQLRAKLYGAEQEKEMAEVGALRKSQIGGAERAEKIRTYNFPQDRITDHRIGKKFHNIEKVLGGELDPIIKAFAKAN